MGDRENTLSIQFQIASWEMLVIGFIEIDEYWFWLFAPLNDDLAFFSLIVKYQLQIIAANSGEGGCSISLPSLRFVVDQNISTRRIRLDSHWNSGAWPSLWSCALLYDFSLDGVIMHPIIYRIVVS